jgi:CDP-paratose 2-epimerase
MNKTKNNGHSNGASSTKASNGSSNGKDKPVLITGGAGFIGTNLAQRFLYENRRVLILDNLSRPGVEKNLNRMLKKYGNSIDVEIADVRNSNKVRDAVKNAAQVFHFAAQVAVTTSLEDPITDFEINAHGTLNVLEAIRSLENPPPLVFTSTNKVYGALDNLALEKKSCRYQPKGKMARENCISERQKVDFHSPYGCSKGAADQYVLDYARTFKLPAVVFRMSCIYGPHQCGTEDQGWVAHFLINILKNKSITIYGDGMQVRDVLYAEDLVDAFRLAVKNIDKIGGQAFNIGGGVENAVSLLELLDFIGDLRGAAYEVNFADWRAADQKYYVSDTRKFQAATGWNPKTSVREGVKKLYTWLQETGELFADSSPSDDRQHPRTAFMKESVSA